ncbi:MAG: threonine--tRNA ligase [bacterium]|nr:threonine--tRNA ligase [bacterium]
MNKNNPDVVDIDFNTKEGKEIYWHSTSHIMAQAVKSIFPEVQLAIGPAIENGFYYDFYKKEPFLPEDLEAIEKEMNEIIKADYPFKKLDLQYDYSVLDAKFHFGKFKTELVEEILKQGQKPTFYHQGDDSDSFGKGKNFVDLCRGPHVKSTGKIGAVKLISIAGAYWHGDEKNEMLQRIYGISFPTPKELKKYLFQIEEAKKRDHRKLGRELKLYNIIDEIGAGLVLYYPRGTALRRVIEDFERKEHYRHGYQEVIGPQILKSDVWKRSGHYGYYKENMYFFNVDNQEFAIKPMNCPGHIYIFESEIRSYRDLPIRYFELGTVHRHEKAGVLHGLLRVRSFTQDDSHIFCRPDQLADEIKGVINFIKYTLNIFGFTEFEMEISTKPEKYIGKDEDWEQATNTLKDTLDALNLPYQINEGDGAFYGPKIDIKLRDALNRTWQCATIQVDFALPERFQLKYTGSDGKEHRPVMIHRVLLGSLDRFMGVLIEHYGGAFPLWLSPVQIKILPISDAHLDYSNKLKEELLNMGFRVEVNQLESNINIKVRDAQKEKIPYMLIIGDKEIESNCISVRERKEGNLGQMETEKFFGILKDRIEKKL